MLFHFPWGQEILHRAQTEHVGAICANEPHAALWFVGWNASVTILILLFLVLDACHLGISGPFRQGRSIAEPVVVTPINRPPGIHASMR